MKNYLKENIKNLPFILVAFIMFYGITTLATNYLFNSNEVSYDNTETGLHADEVQGAIDEVFQHATDYSELKTRVTNIENTTLDNAGFHNSIFRGKSLGSSVTTAQWTAISNGTFEDLYVGDYWTINSVTWRIAGFDIYYNKGDSCDNGTACKAHHAVIVPDTNLTSAVMNDSNTTSGGYVGSKMYTTTLPTVLTTIRNAFGTSHVLKYRALLTKGVNTSATNRYPGTTGASNDWAWYDAYVNLMNMVQVTGNIGFSSSAFDTGADNVQFPLFRLRPEFINKARSWYWVRDVASSARFAIVDHSGASAHGSVSDSGGVRPCFYIG